MGSRNQGKEEGGEEEERDGPECWAGLHQVLTCPNGSRWLLVSLSFWKETSCRIQCAPVAGESGCTYRRPGMAGSALPVTDLNQGTSFSARVVQAGLRARPGLLNVRMIWKWPDPQVSLALRCPPDKLPSLALFLPPHPAPSTGVRGPSSRSLWLPTNNRGIWEPGPHKSLGKLLEGFQRGFLLRPLHSRQLRRDLPTEWASPLRSRLFYSNTMGRFSNFIKRHVQSG